MRGHRIKGAWFKIAKRLLYKLYISIPIIGIRDSGFGVRDSGFGIRDSGFGVRDSGFGVRGSGFGIRDSEFGVRAIRIEKVFYG